MGFVTMMMPDVTILTPSVKNSETSFIFFARFFVSSQSNIKTTNMKRKLILSLALSIFALFNLSAQRIDTVKIHSNAMDRDIENVIVIFE